MSGNFSGGLFKGIVIEFLNKQKTISLRALDFQTSFNNFFLKFYDIWERTFLDASLTLITGCLCTVLKVGPASSLLLTSLFIMTSCQVLDAFCFVKFCKNAFWHL